MQIPAYQIHLIKIDPAAADQLPFETMPENLYPVLDAITVACEKGQLTTDGWVAQCFATPAVFQQFLEALSEYDAYHRLHDRWHAALDRIAENSGNECGFVATADIAQVLEEAADETGQL